MTQTQVMGHLVEKIGISKKEAKLTLDELNALIVRELKKEGARLAGTIQSARARRSSLAICPLHGSARSSRVPIRVSPLPRRHPAVRWRSRVASESWGASHGRVAFIRRGGWWRTASSSTATRCESLASVHRSLSDL
jgi:hypothetical protein